MNFEDIKKLIDDMGESKIDELNIEFPDGIKISMKKDNQYKEVQNIPMQTMVVNTSNQSSVQKDNISNMDNEVNEDYHTVKSPMVGTFYSKSSPTMPAYIEVGKKVKKGDILCIIEAMKLMNEIESEVDGQIVEICVKDGEMVDYGKALFKIKEN